MTATEMALQQEKKELSAAEERTEAGKFFSPYTDIYESEQEVLVTMEVPGVDKAAIDIELEKGVLTVTANIDSRKYEDLEPIYTEYNVGNFVRSFTLSTQDRQQQDRGKRCRWSADGAATEGRRSAAEAHRDSLTATTTLSRVGYRFPRLSRAGKSVPDPVFDHILWRAPRWLWRDRADAARNEKNRGRA